MQFASYLSNCIFARFYFIFSTILLYSYANILLIAFSLSRFRRFLSPSSLPILFLNINSSDLSRLDSNAQSSWILKLLVISHIQRESKGIFKYASEGFFLITKRRVIFMSMENHEQDIITGNIGQNLVSYFQRQLFSAFKPQKVKSVTKNTPHGSMDRIKPCKTLI